MRADANWGPSLCEDSVSEPSQEISHILSVCTPSPGLVVLKLSHFVSQDSRLFICFSALSESVWHPWDNAKGQGQKAAITSLHSGAAVSVLYPDFHFLPLSSPISVHFKGKLCTFYSINDFSDNPTVYMVVYN